MSWTNTQKQLAVRACRAAGISEDQRTDVILRNFQHAHYDGDITSTSPRLSNRDFEAFMAIVEGFAGGKILHFSAGYWRAKADNWLDRMRGRVLRIAAALERAGRLHANGAGLAGWISKRVAHGTTDCLDDLDYHGTLALILGLEAYARTHSVAIDGAGESQTQRRDSRDANLFTSHSLPAAR